MPLFFREEKLIKSTTKIEKTALNQLVHKIDKGVFELCENEDLEFPIVSVKFVDDIYTEIFEIDKEYAEGVLEKEKQIYGLFYINKTNEPIIFINISDMSEVGVVNIFITMAHEITHFYDYISLSKYFKNNDLRILQEDKPFLFWTEFHATFISVLLAIKNKILFLEPENVIDSLEQEFNSYCKSNEPLQLEPSTNYFSRLFGRYIAWKEFYEDKLPAYLNKILFNKKYRKIFEFFYKHKSFYLLKNNIDELSKIIYELME